jgi:hypothetical protein
MLLTGRNKNSVAGLYSFLAVLITNQPFPFEHVDLMLPLMLMVGCETARFHREVTHEESGSTIFLVDQPLYPSSLRVCLGNGRVFYNANVNFMQCASVHKILPDKISHALRELERNCFPRAVQAYLSKHERSMCASLREPPPHILPLDTLGPFLASLR